MVEDVEKIVSRYNQLRSENPLLDERIALEKAFYSEDFSKEDTISTRETEKYTRKRQIEPSECEKGTYRTFEIGKGKKAIGCKVNGKFKVQSILEPKGDILEDPTELYHSIVFDFISDLNDNPELVEDFLTEDVSRKPSVIKKLEKARLEKHQRRTRQLSGVSKRTPQAQALKKRGILPETATIQLPEEIKIGESITPIETPIAPQPFQVPTVGAISGLGNRQMTSVASSFVKGVGAYKNFLLIEYHHDPNIWGYPVGGENAGNFFNELLMSGSKGGWIWDKLLGKPSIYGMAKGKFFSYQDPNSQEWKYYTSPGAQFVHLGERPYKFTYNPVGYSDGSKGAYEQQAKVWKEQKEKIVEPPKSREPAEAKLIEQQQQKEVQLKEELRQLFKQQGLDFSEDSIEDNFNEIRDYITDTLIDLGTKESKEWNKSITEESNEITTWEGLRDFFTDVIADVAYEESEEWRHTLIKDSDNYNTPKEIINYISDVISDVHTESEEWFKSFKSGLKGLKGRGWHGEPERHSKAAKKGKKDLAEDIGAMKKPHKCKYCESQATEAYVWADGRAYIPVCNKHKEKARNQIENTNKDEIVQITKLPIKKDLSEDIEVGRWVTIKGNHVFIPSKPLLKEMEGGNLTHRHDFIDFSKFETDFSEDYTHMYGPISHGRKGGHFDYRDPNDPKKIIRLYKDYDSLKEASKIDYIPMIGTQGKGSHKANVIGFTYGFEPHDDTEEIFAHSITFNNLTDISDILLEAKRQVSIGFEDDIIGDIQYVRKFDHLAMSIDNDEIGRCEMGGKSCFMEVKTDMEECPYGITHVLSGLRQVITITNRGELKN